MKRVILIKWAIIWQTAFLNASAVAISDYRVLSVERPSPVLVIPVLFCLLALFACSVWMASNHRFEPDPARRRKNAYIETAYCVLQALIALLTIRYKMGLAGATLLIAVGIVYILYINPKYMGRKLTKQKDRGGEGQKPDAVPVIIACGKAGCQPTGGKPWSRRWPHGR